MMEATVTINGRKYTVEASLFNHFLYTDGTIRLAVLDGRGNRKLAQFSSEGNFELWEKAPKGGRFAHSRINMRS